MIRRLLFKTALVMMSFCVTVLLMEAGLRVIGYKKINVAWFYSIGKNNFLNQIDKSTIYSTIPNAKVKGVLITDNYGFPLKNELMVNKETKKKIIMLGDSVTWGTGSENRWSYPYLLENEIRNDGGDVTIYNAGVQGFGPDQEFVRFKDYVLPKIKPDVVVWNFNENDISDSNRTCLFQYKNGRFSQLSGAKNLLFWQGWVTRDTPMWAGGSDLANLIMKSWKSIIVGSNVDDRFTVGCSDADFQNEDRKIIYKKMDYFLREMDNLSKKNNFKMLITLVPFQRYFASDLSKSDVDEELFYLRDYLKQNKYFDFVDFNSEILANFSKELSVEREGNAFKASINLSSDKIVGVSSDEKNNLANDFFLDVNQEKDNIYGTRHPNQKMYDLMSFLIKEKVEKLLQ